MTSTHAYLQFTASIAGYGYGLSKRHCNKEGYLRFADYWLTAPKSMDDLPERQIWAEHRFIAPIVNTGVNSGCDYAYNHVVSLAVRDQFKFVNGATLETVVHQKFTPGDSTAVEPTRSKAFERIYFTREYGVTRWEVWNREDHPKLAKNAAYDMYKNMVKGGLVAGDPEVCSKPYDLPSAGANIEFTTGDIKIDSKVNGDGYYEVYDSPSRGKKKWHMVTCHDFTGNILIGNTLETVYQERTSYKPNFLDIKHLADGGWDGVEPVNIEQFINPNISSDPNRQQEQAAQEAARIKAERAAQEAARQRGLAEDKRKADLALAQKKTCENNRAIRLNELETMLNLDLNRYYRALDDYRRFLARKAELVSA